tara:strand:+ start:112 stop:558 length:447 start_codon:yes stop_codon:yes gene_type:complete
MWKILAIGHQTTPWIQAGFEQYSTRLKKPYALSMHTLTPQPGGPQPDQEGQRLSQHIPKKAYVIALDAQGVQHSSESFAHQLELKSTQPVIFLIGGANGLSDAIKSNSDVIWSLSTLTFPHQLAALILAEQLYRTACILQRHPYHRGH